MSDDPQTASVSSGRRVPAASRAGAGHARAALPDSAGVQDGFWATVKRSFRWNVARRADAWIRQPSPKTCGAAALAMLIEAIDTAPRSTDGASRNAEAVEAGGATVNRRDGNVDPKDARLASILGAIGHDDEASLAELQDYALAQGFKAHAYALGLNDLLRVDRPAIVHWRAGGGRSSSGHFVVLRGYGAGHVLVIDPARGNRFWPVKRFARYFLNADGEGYALFVAPADADWLPLELDPAGDAGGKTAAVDGAVARDTSPADDVARRPWHRFF